jgi:hypothetical protein
LQLRMIIPMTHGVKVITSEGAEWIRVCPTRWRHHSHSGLRRSAKRTAIFERRQGRNASYGFSFVP